MAEGARLHRRAPSVFSPAWRAAAPSSHRDAPR